MTTSLPIGVRRTPAQVNAARAPVSSFSSQSGRFAVTPGTQQVTSIRDMTLYDPTPTPWLSPHPAPNPYGFGSAPSLQQAIPPPQQMGPPPSVGAPQAYYMPMPIPTFASGMPMMQQQMPLMPAGHMSPQQRQQQADIAARAALGSDRQAPPEQAQDMEAHAGRQILAEAMGVPLGAAQQAATAQHAAAMAMHGGQLPSMGSMYHASGQCSPCAWFWKAKGCQNARSCQYCHLCPEGELKNRKKAKVAILRAGPPA